MRNDYLDKLSFIFVDEIVLMEIWRGFPPSSSNKTKTFPMSLRNDRGTWYLWPCNKNKNHYFQYLWGLFWKHFPSQQSFTNFVHLSVKLKTNEFQTKKTAFKLKRKRAWLVNLQRLGRLSFGIMEGDPITTDALSIHPNLTFSHGLKVQRNRIITLGGVKCCLQ